MNSCVIRYTRMRYLEIRSKKIRIRDGHNTNVLISFPFHLFLDKKYIA